MEFRSRTTFVNWARNEKEIDDCENTPKSSSSISTLFQTTFQQLQDKSNILVPEAGHESGNLID